MQVFYYQKEPYKPPSGRFKDRVTWDGNIERNDVSIMLWNLQPSDNGTFTCQVTNWPDVYGTIGEVRLRVVQKGESPRVCVDLTRTASPTPGKTGRKGVGNREHERKRRSLRKGFIHRQDPPVCHSVSPHAVNFSEIHFLVVAIGSASVLMIIVVAAVIICRQRRRKARAKRLEVADTEG